MTLGVADETVNTHRCPPPPEETPPAATTNLDIADAAIQRLFRAGLNLAACAGVVKGVAADRVAAAITDLDTVIVELRAAAFAQPPHSADPTVGPAPGQAPAATHSVIQQLAVLARGVGELAEPADGPAVIHHYDAGHSLCRALVALAADPMSAAPSNIARMYLIPILPSNLVCPGVNAF